MSQEADANGLFSAEPEVAPETTENLDAAAPAEPEIAPELDAAPPATEEDKRFAAKFAALTRKEKEVRLKEKKLEARIRELESKTKTEPAPAPQESLDIRLKRNPFETLKELGISYEVLTDMALNQGKPTAELQMQLMREEMDRKYQAKLDEVTNKLKEREEREEQEKQNMTLSQFKRSIADEIKNNTETYELLSVEGDNGIDAVIQVINDHYNETEEIMSTADALNVVEEQLLEEAKKRIELGKIKKLMGASAEKTPEVKPSQPVKKSSVTLSNETTQVQPPSGRFLSDDESKREAAKLIKFNS